MAVQNSALVFSTLFTLLDNMALDTSAFFTATGVAGYTMGKVGANVRYAESAGQKLREFEDARQQNLHLARQTRMASGLQAGPPLAGSAPASLRRS